MLVMRVIVARVGMCVVIPKDRSIQWPNYPGVVAVGNGSNPPLVIQFECLEHIEKQAVLADNPAFDLDRARSNRIYAERVSFNEIVPQLIEASFVDVEVALDGVPPMGIPLPTRVSTA